MTKKSWIVISLVVAAAIAATLVTAFPAEAGKLEDAIAKTPQGVGNGDDRSQGRAGFHGNTRCAQSLLVLRHTLGYLGWMDLLHGGSLRRHYGGCGPHNRIRTR